MGHIDHRSSQYETELHHFGTLRILVLFLDQYLFYRSNGSFSLDINNYEGSLEILKNRSQSADQLTFLSHRLAPYSLQVDHPLVLLESII